MDMKSIHLVRADEKGTRACAGRLPGLAGDLFQHARAAGGMPAASADAPTADFAAPDSDRSDG